VPDAVKIDVESGFTADVYDQINDIVNPPGNPPQGLIFHCAGPTPGGGWRIVDVWDERASFDRFFESQAQPAMAQILGEEALQAGPEPSIESWPVHNYNA
jgi:hypothetical protein